MRHWVLLKGLKQDSRFWDGVPERLAESGPRVHLLDLPGAGRHRDVSAASVPAMTDHLRSELAEARARTPGASWGLLGLSLGGMVALDWARRYPEDWRGVVVGNTSAADTAPAWWRIRPSAVATMARLAALRDDHAREHAVIELVSRRLPPAERQRLAARNVAHQQAMPFTRAALARQLRAASTFRAGRQPLDVPLLVLAGAGDGMVDPRCSHRLADRLRAELRVHPEAGHDLGLDAPDWLVDQLLEWGRRHGA